MYQRYFIFLFQAKTSSNNIVRTCMNAAIYNSNTCIGYKIAFYLYNYKVGLSNTTCIIYLRNYNIKIHSLSNNQIANTSKDLIAIKYGVLCINELSLNNVNYRYVHVGVHVWNYICDNINIDTPFASFKRILSKFITSEKFMFYLI